MDNLLSGNEAVGYAAYHMNAFGAGYPGTPSTEIIETMQTLYSNGKARWSTSS